MKTIIAEILTIGDELLLGQTLDTNSHWICGELAKIGVRTQYKSTVGDKSEHILQALHIASERADLVLITGGLGPTKDDITKKTIADFFGVGYREDEAVLAHLEHFFASRGREFNDLNRTQIYLPTNSETIMNDVGTAPSMWIEHEGKVFISMPGVPFEMKYLMQKYIIQRIIAHFNPEILISRFIRTIGIAESKLAMRIKDWESNLPSHIKLAYLPHYSRVSLRMTASGEDATKLREEIAAQEKEILPLIHEYVFGFDDEDFEIAIGKMLVKYHKTVATAESCTGGFLAHSFTMVSGSSSYYLGGIVSYSNNIKVNQLGVQAETLLEHGAVSQATAIEMAENVRDKYGSDFGLAATGIAGPTGGTPQKPVGMVWIALSTPTGTYTRKLQLSSERDVNIRVATYSVMDLLRRYIHELPL